TFREPAAKTLPAVAFSSDGKTLAGGGFGMTCIWDLTERAQLGKIGGEPDNAVRTVAFSPTNKRLAIGSIDGLRLIDVASDSWQKRARLIANREFTDEEKSQYY